jgi:hypothetical protein
MKAILSLYLLLIITITISFFTKEEYEEFTLHEKPIVTEINNSVRHITENIFAQKKHSFIFSCFIADIKREINFDFEYRQKLSLICPQKIESYKNKYEDNVTISFYLKDRKDRLISNMLKKNQQYKITAHLIEYYDVEKYKIYKSDIVNNNFIIEYFSFNK